MCSVLRFLMLNIIAEQCIALECLYENDLIYRFSKKLTLSWLIQLFCPPYRPVSCYYDVNCYILNVIRIALGKHFKIVIESYIFHQRTTQCIRLINIIN